MSPLLQRIERELDSTVDPTRRAELVAEQACYFARSGTFDQARANIDSLRGYFSDGRSPRISILMMLAEGLLLYYEKFDPSSTDRISRAHALSVAIGADDLIRLTASWLANMEFNRSEFAAMEHALRRCPPGEDSAVSAPDARVQLVLANSYAYCGDTNRARYWYAKARNCAISLGDEALIEAIIFNRAAFSLSKYRIDCFNRGRDDATVRALELEVASARSYYLGARHGALPQLLEACIARIDVMHSRFAAAEAKFSEILRQGKHSAFLPDGLLIAAEHAECLTYLGKEAPVAELIARVSSGDHAGMGLDDQLTLVNVLSSLAERSHDESLLSKIATLRTPIAAAYEAEVASLQGSLERLSTLFGERKEGST